MIASAKIRIRVECLSISVHTAPDVVLEGIVKGLHARRAGVCASIVEIVLNVAGRGVQAALDGASIDTVGSTLLARDRALDHVVDYTRLLPVRKFIPFLAVFLFYPLFLLLTSSKFPPPQQQQSTVADRPTVTMLIAVRNGEALIKAKLENCLSLAYPSGRLNFIVFSDKIHH